MNFKAISPLEHCFKQWTDCAWNNNTESIQGNCTEYAKNRIQNKTLETNFLNELEENFAWNTI